MSQSLTASPTTAPPAAAGGATAKAKAPPRKTFADRLVRVLDIASLGWFIPLVEIGRGAAAGPQLRKLAFQVLLPLTAIAAGVLAWQGLAIATRGGLSVPGPGLVWDRGMEQVEDWRKQQIARAEHESEVAKTIAEMLADEAKAGPVSAAKTAEITAQVTGMMTFTPKKLFIDQLLLSLQTVLVGVGMAVLIAVPIGILCGLSGAIFTMANPFIQLLRPVSPLAWFPVVYIFVNKSVATTQGGVSKPFIMAAIVVCLCALWPTLINTANGVANVDKDYRNVARVLRLGWFATVWRIILPASVPSIFTGIRLTLGIGWMVLIAAEMMAVSPGMGGFVWDWYQSSNDIALSYLILAVIVIGGTGFLLDRCMVGIQKLVTYGPTTAIR